MMLQAMTCNPQAMFMFDIHCLLFQSLIAMPKTKRQVLLCSPEVSSSKDFTDASLFSINHQYAVM